MLLLGVLFSNCHKTSAPAQLTLSQYSVFFTAEGGTVKVVINSNRAWKIDSLPGAWLKFNKTSGNSGTDSVLLTASPNSTSGNLSASFAISSGGLSSLVTVAQAYPIFPSYNTSPVAPDASGMGSTAAQITANIKLGWNIYNTMEAPGGETGWGNPVITQAQIDLISQSGVNAIRIPCAWNFHADQSTGAIDTAWLSRVKQVVQYCMNDGMYVLLNCHWDGGWLDCTATGAKLDTVKAKQKAFWEQIATKMRDFDEHLMLASANEPNATDLPTATVLENYHQIFINAVRSTGGKNAFRTLVIQAPGTSIDLADYFTVLPGMPVDQVPNKLIVEVHWYSPSNFCLLTSDASWGPEWRYWGANYHSTDDLMRNAAPGTEESYMDSTLSGVNKRYIKNNIPFLIGEFGVENHAVNILGNPTDSILSLNSRAHFFRYLVQQARNNGIPAFLWAGVFDRASNTVNDPQALDSLRAGAGF